MTAYIEYVFLENFLLDGLLLYGASRFTKMRIGKIRLFISACVGGAYALLSPFITLPIVLEKILTMCVGVLLTLLAYGRLKNKTEWGRYAFFCFTFFVFACMVAGFILAVWDKMAKKPPFLLVLVLMAVCIGIGETFAYVYHKKSQVFAQVINCYIMVGKKRILTRGFLDSGNLAQKDGVPICFICPLAFYKAFGFPQREERAVIQTMTGERETAVYLGEIALKKGESTLVKQVYFAPTKNMLFREYEMILPARIMEE